MGKLNQDFSDCIKKGSKLKNGGFVLGTMGGGKILCCGLAFFTLVIMGGVYVIPNPYGILLPNYLVTTFRIIIICSLLLSVTMCIRIMMIYRKDKPWRNGLEYTLYFLIIAFLFSLSFLMNHITIYYYLPTLPRLSIYITLLCLIIMSCWSVRLLVRRMRGSHQQKKKKKELPAYQKAIGIGSSIGVGIFLISQMFSTDFELLLVYICSGFISCVFLWIWPFIIQNIYVFVRYRKDLDLDCCYQKIDGIDPNKNYKGKF